MESVVTSKAYALACELAKILPELTDSALALSLIEQLCQELKPFEPTHNPARDAVALKKSIEQEEARVKAAKDALAKRLEATQAEMLENGVSNQKVDGTTFYQSRLIRANIKAADMEPACKAILRHRKDSPRALVKYSINATSLTAWVRELPRNEDEEPILPSWLAPFITLQLGWETRMRKA